MTAPGEPLAAEAGDASPPGPDGVDGPPRPAGLADGEWHRMHPLTPLIRFWQFFVVVLFVVAQNYGDDVVRGEGFPELHRPEVAGRVLAGGGALVLLVLLVLGGFVWLSWRMTRFRVTADALELNSGVVSRQQRRAPLDRVQAVDVVQPLIARLVGLARLTLEVAGGSGSRVALSYLTEAQAQSLRGHLLARAAGVRYDGHEAPEAPEHEAVEVPAGRLVGSLALSGAAVALLVAAVGLLTVGVVSREVGPLLGIGPVVLGAAGALWARFNAGFAFRVATSPDGVRLRHGLLEHRAQTVPPGRVQAVRLRQPLLWRGPDWWAVHVNVAGYGGAADPGGSTESVLLPVGTRAEAVAVAALVLPELGVRSDEDPWTVVEAGMIGRGPAHDFRTAPDRARWVDPVAWRRTGVRVTEHTLLIRRGRLHRMLDVVPHARSQSWGLAQGPFQRRLGLASFALHSTPGPVNPVVPHLDAADAAALLGGQAGRALRAREAAGPERWMEEVPEPGHPPAGESSAE